MMLSLRADRQRRICVRERSSSDHALVWSGSFVFFEANANVLGALFLLGAGNGISTTLVIPAFMRRFPESFLVA